MTAHPPILLAIDTAGSACSVALARGNAVIASEHRGMRHGHAEALLPMIDAITRHSSIAPGMLDIVAVSVGPGGFTGIRVGLAAARGIALAAKARLIGVSSFAAAAALVQPDTPDPVAVLVALDSRREELYVQLFHSGAPLAEPASLLSAQLAAYVAASIGDRALLLAGDAAASAARHLPQYPDLTIARDTAPDARGVLAAAQSRLRSGLASEPARPLYLRPPDVTMPKPAPRR